MEPRIVVVEDDYQDATWISQELRVSLNAKVEVVPCERDFVALIPDLASNKPAIIIFDVMLRWATASVDLEREVEEGRVPEDVIREGYLRAGLRCFRRLKARDDTKDIPCLVYTGLKINNFSKTDNFSDDVIHIADIITKSEDIRPLVAAVRKKLGLRQNQL